MMRLYRVASSLQVGIGLLILVTVASLVGVIIPQGLEAQRYLHQWGTVGGGLLLGAGLDRLFSTLWYNILLGLFAFNVLLCTAGRIRSTIAAVFTSRFLSTTQINALAQHAVIEGGADVAVAAAKVLSFFRKQGYSVAQRQCDEGLALDIRKGRTRDFGSALLHFSLLPLLIGGLMGKIGGISYMQQLSQGESAPVAEHPFFVRCNFFSIEQNDRGQIKSYKSGLTLLDSAGDSLAGKVIEVNHPLTYHGVKFYQSSYREDPSMVNNVELVITGPLAGAIGKKVVVRPGVAAMIRGTGIVVLADGFMPDFMFDRATGSAVNRSMEPNNPAVFVTVTQGVDTLFARWTFQKFGAMHHPDDTYNVTFVNYDSPMSTGLLIKQDTGAGVIWFGIIGMSLGVMLVFWVSRRRYWVIVRSGDAGATGVHIGGIRSRDDVDGVQRFDDAVASLRKLLNG